MLVDSVKGKKIERIPNIAFRIMTFVMTLVDLIENYSVKFLTIVRYVFVRYSLSVVNNIMSWFYNSLVISILSLYALSENKSLTNYWYAQQ